MPILFLELQIIILLMDKAKLLTIKGKADYLNNK